MITSRPRVTKCNYLKTNQNLRPISYHSLCKPKSHHLPVRQLPQLHLRQPLPTRLLHLHTQTLLPPRHPHPHQRVIRNPLMLLHHQFHCFGALSPRLIIPITHAYQLIAIHQLQLFRTLLSRFPRQTYRHAHNHLNPLPRNTTQIFPAIAH